jgi:gamma-glutamyltranspeptidase / glutathione hydrolase
VIVQAMAQVLLNPDARGMTLQQAVEAPRFAVFDYPGAFYPNEPADRLLYLEGRFDPETVEFLRVHGHVIRQWPPFEFDAGSVAVVVSKDRDEYVVLEAAADPRRSAYALAR